MMLQGGEWFAVSQLRRRRRADFRIKIEAIMSWRIHVLFEPGRRVNQTRLDPCNLGNRSLLFICSLFTW